MTSDATIRPGPPTEVSLALLVLIAFSGTLGMHVFVPALPAAAESLRVDSQTIQFSITIYILGLAIGQLFYGPLSDAIGRRPSVLLALGICVCGGLASFFASNIVLLLVARLVQALGGAGALAITRVIVADTNKGAPATRKIAILNLILLVGPGLAPVVGAEIAELFDWRMIFLFLALLGAVGIGFSLISLPETAVTRQSAHPARIFHNFRTLLQDKNFFRVVSGGAFGSTACYGYFVSAPFILSESMGLSTRTVGYCVGATLAAAAVGNMLTRSIVGRVRDRQIQLTYAGLAAATGATFLLSALTNLLTPVWVVAMSMLILFCAGGLSPVSISMSLRHARDQAGSAAGLFGFFQMSSGVICSSVAGFFSDHALGCGIVLCGAYVFCFSQFFRVQHDEI